MCVYCTSVFLYVCVHALSTRLRASTCVLRFVRVCNCVCLFRASSVVSLRPICPLLLVCFVCCCSHRSHPPPPPPGPPAPPPPPSIYFISPSVFASSSPQHTSQGKNRPGNSFPSALLLFKIHSPFSFLSLLQSAFFYLILLSYIDWYLTVFVLSCTEIWSCSCSFSYIKVNQIAKFIYAILSR